MTEQTPSLEHPQVRKNGERYEIVVDDAVQVWVVHDSNPHALSPRVKSYTQAQHWFQDLSTLA